MSSLDGEGMVPHFISKDVMSGAERPSTVAVTRRGWVIGAIRAKIFENIPDIDNARSIFLTTMAVHHSGRIVLESHIRSTADGDLVADCSYCDRHVIDGEGALYVGLNGNSYERVRYPTAENPGDEYAQSDMDRLDRKLWGQYRAIACSPPSHDVFNPENYRSHSLLMEVLQDHKILDPATRLAVDGITRMYV
jgi:hypothetical protein